MPNSLERWMRLTLRYLNAISLAPIAAAAPGIVNLFSRVANAPGASWQRCLNVSHVGFIGYSFDGAVVAAQLDDRIGAIISLDGARSGGTARANSVNGPYLPMLSDTHYLARRLLASRPAPQAPTRFGNHYALDFRGACA